MALQHRYRITHRIVDGTTVLGYKLQDFNGDFIIKSKADTAQLALDGYIDNAKAQRDLKHGGLIIKGYGCELKKLPSITIRKDKKIDHEIIARLVQGKLTVGYKLLSSAGGESVVKVEKAVDMARRGEIRCVKLQKFGDIYRLRGANGFELNKVPVIKISTDTRR